MSHSLATFGSNIYFQRRTRQPYGLEGGGPGDFGRNTWIKRPRESEGDVPEGVESGKADARLINIGGKATLLMGKGDRLLIETPGGGAWGPPDPDQEEVKHAPHKHGWEARGSLAERAAAQASFGGF